MWIYQRPFKQLQRPRRLFGEAKKCAEKNPQKTAIEYPGITMVRIQFMDFKKSRFQFLHDQKKEAKEFQPWVKLHVFGFLPLVFYLFFFREVVPPLGGYGIPFLKKPWKLMLGTILSFWEGIFSGGELLGFRRCIRKPNHLGIPWNSFKMLPRPGCNRHHYNDELHLIHGMPFWGWGSTPAYHIFIFGSKTHRPKMPSHLRSSQQS